MELEVWMICYSMECGLSENCKNPSWIFQYTDGKHKSSTHSMVKMQLIGEVSLCACVSEMYSVKCVLCVNVYVSSNTHTHRKMYVYGFRVGKYAVDILYLYNMHVSTIYVYGLYRTTPPIFFSPSSSSALPFRVSRETSGKETPHWKLKNHSFWS